MTPEMWNWLRILLAFVIGFGCGFMVMALMIIAKENDNE